MSDVVEKTLTALPALLALDSQPGAGKLSSTSKLRHLIRSITELTSKHVSIYPNTTSSAQSMRSCSLSCVPSSQDVYLLVTQLPVSNFQLVFTS